MELEGARAIVGCCQTMCPQAEMRLREKEGLLHPFESVSQSKSQRPRADPQRMVKEYSRPAAGRTDAIPANIRPPAVLLSTVAYLFKHIIIRQDDDWVRVYDFVFDRLRAVRQDAVVQCVDGENAITLLEQMVRFHVYAGYRLCEAPQEAFDPVINDQHLLECLKRLLRLYTTTPGDHHNQPQFEMVYLLHNLGSTDSLLHGLSLPGLVRHALQVMSAAYSSKNCRYPVASLQQVLREGRGELMELAHACGLVEEGDVIQAQYISFLRSKFTPPTKMRVHYEADIDKRLESLDISSWLLGKQISNNDS
ncbi:hypothetical protein BaRGS_00010943 [Batillaria attramentaria]|uniref:SAC3/GANP/THP3 conserved domain-containing protein n=1 Tax=Batillaria attramentaria TaxID=370345 RepID=A0ABD0LEB4_9CAEN